MILHHSDQRRGWEAADEVCETTRSIPQRYLTLIVRDPSTSLCFAHDDRHE